MTEQIKELEAKIKQLEIENKTLKDRDATMKKIFARMRTDKDEVELTLKAAEQHIKKIENENIIFRKLINEKLDAERLTEVERERNTYKIEWESTKELLAECEEDVATKNKIIFDQNKQIKRLCVQLEQKEDALIKLAEKASKKADNQIVKQQKKIEELEQELAVLKQTHYQDIKDAKEQLTQVLEENWELQMKNNNLEARIEYRNV